MGENELNLHLSTLVEKRKDSADVRLTQEFSTGNLGLSWIMKYS
jgi:hypothetical protein